MAIKFTDGDILNAMIKSVDETSMVYGANGHYSVGAYYNLYGNGYNTEENTDAAKNAPAAQGFTELTDKEKIALGLI